MKSSWKMTLFIALSALLLSACETAPKMELTEGFGNAVRTNVALQVINPDAGKAQPVATSLDGKKAKAGMDRYYAETGEADTEELVK